LLSELLRRLESLRDASKLAGQPNPRSKFFSVDESPLLQEIFEQRGLERHLRREKDKLILDYDAGSRSRGQYRKREAKAALNKVWVAQLRQATWRNSGRKALTRAQITALLGISNQEYGRLARPQAVVQPSPPLSKSPQLLEAVHQIIRDVGLHNLTTSNVLARLSQRQFSPLPSATTVQRLLRESFGLSYRPFDSAKLRFSQRLYDPKRQAICRYLATLLIEDALIVCVDESAFSTRQTTRWRWQPMSSSVRSQMQQEARLHDAQRRLPEVHSAAGGLEAIRAASESLSESLSSDLEVADERDPGSPPR